MEIENIDIEMAKKDLDRVYEFLSKIKAKEESSVLLGEKYYKIREDLMSEICNEFIIQGHLSCLKILQDAVEPLIKEETNGGDVSKRDYQSLLHDTLVTMMDTLEGYKSKSSEIEKERVRYTYLMTDSNTGYTKIGRSINPKKRERTLQSEKPTITLLAVTEGDIEHKLQQFFTDSHIRGEWYDLTEKEIDFIIDSYSFKIVGNNE